MQKQDLYPAKPISILIIEDENDICFVLNVMLAGKHIGLNHVNSIAEAKRYLHHAVPTIIILDNKLPDGLGVEFAETIRKEHPSVKLVMMSGMPFTTKELALSHGADIFLEKPFSKAKLYESLQLLLN